jgi:hypothetical protein
MSIFSASTLLTFPKYHLQQKEEGKRESGKCRKKIHTKKAKLVKAKGQVRALQS